MAKLYDWVKQKVSGAPGTGNVNLGIASTNFITFADAGIIDGETFYYTIVDGDNRERGIGTYTSASNSFARTWIQAKIENGVYSANPGTGLNLTSAAVVGCSPVSDTHNHRGALVYKTSAQTLTQNADNLITYDSEEYDPDGFHSTSTNTGRLTIPPNLGIKKIRLMANCRVYFTALNNSYAIKFLKNGSTFIGQPAQTVPPPSTYNIPCNIVSPVIDVIDGDYFEVWIYIGSGGVVTEKNDSNNQSWFSIEVIE